MVNVGLWLRFDLGHEHDKSGGTSTMTALRHNSKHFAGFFSVFATKSPQIYLCDFTIRLLFPFTPFTDADAWCVKGK